MTRERESVSAQLTQAEQVKLVAEGELAEVRPSCNCTQIIACQQDLYVLTSWPSKPNPTSDKRNTEKSKKGAHYS